MAPCILESTTKRDFRLMLPLLRNTIKYQYRRGQKNYVHFPSIVSQNNFSTIFVHRIFDFLLSALTPVVHNWNDKVSCSPYGPAASTSDGLPLISLNPVSIGRFINDWEGRARRDLREIEQREEKTIAA